MERVKMTNHSIKVASWGLNPLFNRWQGIPRPFSAKTGIKTSPARIWKTVDCNYWTKCMLKIYMIPASWWQNTSFRREDKSEKRKPKRTTWWKWLKWWRRWTTRRYSQNIFIIWTISSRNTSILTFWMISFFLMSQIRSIADRSGMDATRSGCHFDEITWVQTKIGRTSLQRFSLRDQANGVLMSILSQARR